MYIEAQGSYSQERKQKMHTYLEKKIHDNDI